jgi:GGDEF domain-containing protein
VENGGISAGAACGKYPETAMPTLNRNELDHLERRELHLTVLAAVFVLVQAAGLAVLMYPLVFLRADGGNKWPLRVAYFGFCALTVLFACYLLDRQRVVRKLKQNLLEQLERNIQIRQQASADVLHSMPGQDHFWDRLTMEHRRAMTMNTTLSLLLAQSKRGANNQDPKQRQTAWGEAAKAISSKLRPTDSIYNISPEVFAIVLPETDSLNAKRVAVRLQEALQDVRAKYGFNAELTVHNYPENVASSHELEDIVKSLLPENHAWEQPTQTTLA